MRLIVTTVIELVLFLTVWKLSCEPSKLNE